MSLPKQQMPRPSLRPRLRLIIGGLSHKALRRKANAWVYTLFVIGALILVNVLGARFPWRLDLTKDKLFSLSEQTVEVLSKLPGEVKAIGFYTDAEAGARSYMEDLLREYVARAKGKFTYEMVDPADAPSLIRQYDLNFSGTTVLTYNGKHEKLDQWDLMGGMTPDGRPQINGEQALTNALIRLTAERTPRLYFIEGHGEKPMGEWQSQLRKESYISESLNFATKNEVPADADTLVISGPTRDFDPRELEQIDKWVDQKGGRIVVLLDPGTTLPVLEGWLQKWGITLRNDVVVDPERNYSYDAAAPVPSYRYHAITNRVDNARLAMVMPRVRSMAYPDAKDGFLFSPLLVSSDKAWGETTLSGQAARDEKDTAGPLTMAVAVTRQKVGKTESAPEKPEARLVVIGSSTFAIGDVLRVQGNLDFIMGVAGWLTDRGESLTIRAKEPISVPMFFRTDQAIWIFVGTVVALPLLFLATGGFVWLRRRHL